MNPQERILLRLLEAQIETECRFILMANAQLQRANALPMRPIAEGQFGRAEQIQFAVRSLVVAAANVSKLAWGNGSGKEVDKNRRYLERAELRDELGLVDGSPLSETLLRNDFEHIDTRIEEQQKKSPTGNLSMGGVSLGVPQDAVAAMGDVFGHYFRDTGHIIFWSPLGKREVSAPDVVAEAQRILALLETLRRDRRGVIPYQEWLALQAELQAEATSNNPHVASEPDTAPNDSPNTAPEARPEEPK